MSRPMGVVVPPASGRARVDPLTPAGGRAKDSVELLLEGMAGPRPDRTKTMPQTDGEASAAYHSEHAVRAGRTAHDEERKVLVDTVRLPIGVGAEDLDVRAPLPDPTYVLPARLAPRVVVAIMAGLLVVVALFAALDRSASVKRDPVAAPAAQPPAAAPIEPSSPSVPAGPAPALAAVPQQPQAGPAEQPPAADLARPQSAPVATRPRASVQRSKPGAPDVGEFKTSF